MRETWSLNGSWQFVTDPLQVGEREAWFQQERLWQDAREVTVPHIWQSEGGELVGYSGMAWYRRNVTHEDINRSQEYYLIFGAVDYRCTVWWNGTEIGHHEGGFTPFELRIPASLMERNNVLTVSVFDPRDNAEIPIGKQGSWYTRVSGIWQSVKLEGRSAAHVQRVLVTPDVDAMHVDVHAELRLGTAAGVLRYEVRPHAFGEQDGFEAASYSGELVLGDSNAAGEFNNVDWRLPVPDMLLWSPETPYLYELEANLVDGETIVDRYVTTFGLRKVMQKDGRIWLNHRPVYIRGALDQAFYPKTIYTASSESDIRRELDLAKQMGFNMLRKHIKVETPEYLYWADRMGMLIWAEPPNYVKWTESARSRFVAELAAMLKRDYNHPSIIIWSIYNEEWGLEWDLAFDPDKQRHVAELFDTVKAWDPTRLICDNSGWTHIKTDINDHHRYFACPDQLDAWRRDLDELVIGDPNANFVEPYVSRGEPILVSEFGVWGLPSMERLRQYYDGNEPWWFINQGDETHQDDYKKPVTALDNMHKYGLDSTFGDFEKLAVHSQRRMFRAVKSLVEEMRKRPAIGGYIVTEFTDIEWETNGWLDFLRQPKEGFERLIDFNGPACVFAEVERSNLWAGEQLAWDLLLTDDQLADYRGVVKWKLAGSGLSGEVVLNDMGPWACLKGALTFTVPEVTAVMSERLELSWHVGDRVVARNEYELTMSPRTVRVVSGPDVVTHRMEAAFSNALAARGRNVVAEATNGAVLITDCLDAEAEQFARSGGSVLFLAERGDRSAASGPFTFRELPPGESWPRASSMNYVNPAYFGGLPLQPEMGWELEGLHPDYVLPFTDYKKVGVKRTVNMFGNPGTAEAGEVIAGYFQGWLGQNGGSIVRHPLGIGYVTIVTWKLIEAYRNQPMAVHVLHRLIDIANEGSGVTDEN
ncbi:glycoside hydrolase family 2 protein [Paenibacillus silviterrae]|uniref:glycoside hydrolase family 2 protein n=1 Tax=Paenibacillus silviterrae TaxID=3242194 RepID=UPI002542C57B|nr:sugar-binding domain-containing protein [Paenibacillus chinjuensis]